MMEKAKELIVTEISEASSLPIDPDRAEDHPHPVRLLQGRQSRPGHLSSAAMLLSSILLFLFFVLLSAFFSSSETAFIGSNPYTLEYLENKGSKTGRAVTPHPGPRRRFPGDHPHRQYPRQRRRGLAGHVSSSASFVADRETAVLLATIATTLILLVLLRDQPKIYAAYNPLKISLLFSAPDPRSS